jgi:hypothetical protein
MYSCLRLVAVSKETSQPLPTAFNISSLPKYSQSCKEVDCGLCITQCSLSVVITVAKENIFIFGTRYRNSPPSVCKPTSFLGKSTSYFAAWRGLAILCWGFTWVSSVPLGKFRFSNLKRVTATAFYIFSNYLLINYAIIHRFISIVWTSDSVVK